MSGLVGQRAESLVGRAAIVVEVRAGVGAADGGLLVGELQAALLVEEALGRGDGVLGVAGLRSAGERAVIGFLILILNLRLVAHLN